MRSKSILAFMSDNWWTPENAPLSQNRVARNSKKSIIFIFWPWSYLDCGIWGKIQGQHLHYRVKIDEFHRNHISGATS